MTASEESADQRRIRYLTETLRNIAAMHRESMLVPGACAGCGDNVPCLTRQIAEGPL